MSRSRSRSLSGPRYLLDRLPQWAVGPQSPTPTNADEPRTLAPSAAAASTDRVLPPSEHQRIAAAIADMEAHRPLEWTDTAHQLHRPLSGSTRGHLLLDQRLRLSGATFHAQSTWNLAVTLERQVPEDGPSGASLDVRRLTVPPDANPTPRPEMAAQQPLTAGTSEISAASLLDATETAPAEGAHHQFEDGLLPSGSSGDSPSRDS